MRKGNPVELTIQLDSVTTYYYRTGIFKRFGIN